jgi:hypothetical protein
MPDHSTLIARLEAATEGSRELSDDEERRMVEEET